MTAIWRHTQDGYRRLGPTGFPNEAELHELISRTPELLPLAGAPDLVVLGNEVALGNGYADVLAIERGGRFVLVEVKLARNSEARRAVVAQLLSYASFLRGNEVAALEQGTLATHLRQRGASDIASLARSGFQDETIAGDAFCSALQQSLDSGSFRLVLVLDDAPAELVSLVGYLEEISAGIVIDLVTVAQYELGSERVVVPQRVEPGRLEPPSADSPPDGPSAITTPGADDFVASIAMAPVADQPLLARLAEWAKGLEQRGLVRLVTTSGVTGRKVLKPYVVGEQVGLVTVWNENGVAALSVWRTVFDRCAPNAISRLEAVIGDEVGNGRSVSGVNDEVLQVLTGAYEEASTRAAADVQS